MSRKPQRVVVIGGGIAGLAAAHKLVELRERANADFELLLLEASGRLGGVIGTDRRDGFVMEWGPDSFISEKPWALKLSERIGLAPHLVGTNDEHRRNFVVRGGKLHALPDGFLLMAPTKFWSLLRTRVFSWPGKVRMGMDLLLPRGAEVEDESLGSFVTRRLGREALERVVQPLIGGIYTADPDELSLAATMPRFLEMERQQRSVIRSMWTQARKTPATRGTSGPRWSLFVTLDRGMQGMVDALVERLPADSIRQSCGVRGVTHAGGWRIATTHGDEIAADAVIIATPAYETARMIESCDPLLAVELRGISYASSATVSLAYERSAIRNRLDGFGFVVPHVEKRGILACTYSSVKYSGRAPQGYALLRTFVGGALQEERALEDDEAMLANVQGELAQLLGVTAPPLFTNIHRHRRAMPQYRVGHLQRLVRIDARVSENPGLQLAGNAYRGVGIPDCIHSGEQAAEALAPLLRAQGFTLGS